MCVCVYSMYIFTELLCFMLFINSALATCAACMPFVV